MSNKRSSNPARTAGRGKDGSVLELHFQYAAALVAGVAAINLNATGLSSVSTRFLSVGDTYAYYRYRSLAFRLFPVSSTNQTQACGYTPVLDNSPTSVLQLIELLPSALLSTFQSVPTEWVRVPSKDLAGPFPWYKTISGTPDTTEEFPGSIQIVGNGTNTFLLEVRAVVELKEAVAPANTPLEVDMAKKRRQMKELAAAMAARDSILRVMSLPPAPSGKTPDQGRQAQA